MTRRSFFAKLAIGVASAPKIAKAFVQPVSAKDQIALALRCQTPYNPEALRSASMEWHRRGIVFARDYKPMRYEQLAC